VGRVVLTSQEKRVISFVVAAFLVGLLVKCYRDQRPASAPSSTKPTTAESQPAAADARHPKATTKKAYGD